MDIDNSDLDMILNRFRTMNTNDKDYLINEFKRLSNTQLSTEGCSFYLDLAEWNLNTALWAYYEYENREAAANSVNLQNPTHNTTSMQQLANIYTNYANELPEMQFLCDVTIGEGESVHPNTHFIKTWRLKNSGTQKWPANCQLKYVNGYNFSQCVEAGSTSSISSLTSDSSSTILNSATNEQPILLGLNDAPVSIEVRELEPQEICDISISLKAPRQCGIYQCQYRMFTSLNQPFGDPIWLLLNVEEGGVLSITQQLNSVSMFGNWNTGNQAGAAVSSNSVNCNNNNNNNENIFSKSPFDNNYNLIGQDHNQSAPENQRNMEEKRPDFYDDMFS